MSTKVSLIAKYPQWPASQVYLARYFMWRRVKVGAHAGLAGMVRFWILFDQRRKMPSAIGESKRKLIQRWETCFGPTGKIIQYQGVMRESELACTIASIRHPNPLESAP